MTTEAPILYLPNGSPYRSASQPAAATPPPTMGEISAEAGDLIGSDFVNELRLPRDAVLELHGQGDPEFYDRLLSDDQVYPCFQQRRSAVIAREWKVDPGGDAPIDAEAADFIRDQMDHISWDRTTMRMLGKLINGYGVAECMFRVTPSGLVELDAVKVRRSSRFRFALDGSLRLLRFGTPLTLPARKFWTFTAGAEDDDDLYGRGLGHWLYWPVWFKRNGIKFWATFLEGFSSPLPVLTGPAGTTDAERQKLLDLLAACIQSGRIFIPRGVDLELVQSMKDSGGDYGRFVDRMDAAIAKIILTQTMTTDNGASLSQAQVHERAQIALTKGDSDLLTESWSRGPVRWLTEWNFPGAAVPIVYRDFSIAEDLDKRAERDTKLNQIGYRPTPAYILDTYGDGYELAPVQAQPAASPADPLSQFSSGFAELPRDEGVAVEDIVSGQGWRSVLGPEVDAIDQFIGDARSLRDVRKRLDELALREPTRLIDGLARVMFAARVQGAAGAEPTPEDTAAEEQAKQQREVGAE